MADPTASATALAKASFRNSRAAMSMVDPDYSESSFEGAVAPLPLPRPLPAKEPRATFHRHWRLSSISTSAVVPFASAFASAPPATASPTKSEPPARNDASASGGGPPSRRISAVLLFEAESTFSRYASAIATRFVHVDHRVVKHGLSLPIILVFSVAICVSHSLALFTSAGIEWIPNDLTGETEWTSHTRTHLAQDPLVLLHDLLQPATIGVDTSVSVNFLTKYGVATEVNAQSTAATFNATWLDPQFILGHGFTIAGQMAGAFEAYGAWPCAKVVATHPIVETVCRDPAHDWFAIQIYNNRVATTSEKASTFLSLDYTPLALMTARIWQATPPRLMAKGIVVHGYKEDSYTQRAHYLLKLEAGELALAEVLPCARATQSNALECDYLESDDIYVRNYARRDFEPLAKLNKLQVFGPAYAMGNYVAANKNYVQLPAVAILMTDAGYSATTRFSTTFPFRLTIHNGLRLTTEYSIPQIASYSNAVGKGFATAAIQMIIVCMIVYNAIAHCRTSRAVAALEGQIFGFTNHITMGIIARRLGTYKFVAMQLCAYHAFNVRRYFAAVLYGTQKRTDTVAFGAEGFLLVVVCSMLLDQLIFFERYASLRETLTIIGSCSLYLAFLALNSSSHLLSSRQVQVTELSVCASANQCTLIIGYEYYYVGVVACLLVPVLVVNIIVDRYIVPTRSRYPAIPEPRDKLTTFEKFCVGVDARVEFGDFDRSRGTTPISIVHAAGFTYVGPYLLRVKDYYLVVLGRWLPEPVIKSSGLTVTLFRLKDGRVVAGRHMILAAAYKLFRDASGTEDYQCIK